VNCYLRRDSVFAVRRSHLQAHQPCVENISLNSVYDTTSHVPCALQTQTSSLGNANGATVYHIACVDLDIDKACSTSHCFRVSPMRYEKQDPALGQPCGPLAI
jgi:hypothetical protein